MLDIGWSEMAVIALLALIIIGPKDLPRVMRSIGQWMRKARSVAREFQSGLDDMMREAELDEARKTIERSSNLDVGKELEAHVDPTGSVREDAADLERSARAGADDEEGKTGRATYRHQESPTAPGHSVPAGSAPAQDGEGEREGAPETADDDAGKEPADGSSTAGAAGRGR